MIRFTLLIINIFCLTSHSISQSVQSSYLIKTGKLYDAEKNVFTTNQEIYVQGNKIKKIGQNLKVPEITVIIDASNSTVTPGLIDAHTHILMEQKVNEDLVTDVIENSNETRLLRAVSYGKSYLKAGFTTIRDLGNSGQYLDVELRNAINNGFVEGPRMFVSGPIIGSYDGQFGGLSFKDHESITKQEYRIINGVDDARLAVNEHIVQFVDVIKILAFGNRLPLSLEEMKAIVETAHANWIQVTAHADRDWVVHNAIEAGVDGIEHGYGFKDATLKKMADEGIYLVPTFGSVDVAIHYYKMMDQPYDLEELKKNYQPNQKVLISANELGVMIVAGSDAYHNVGIPRGDAAKLTLVGYYEAGLEVNDVLKTATYNASIALNRKDQLGVIKENALADISIFQGDLEKDFKKSIFNVQLVMKDGKIQYDDTSLKY